MYVFGGCTCTSTTFNDFWKLDLSTRKWVRLLTMGTYPTPKACATLVYYEGTLVLFGGWTHPSPYPLHQVNIIFKRKILKISKSIICLIFKDKNADKLYKFYYDFN